VEGLLLLQIQCLDKVKGKLFYLYSNEKTTLFGEFKFKTAQNSKNLRLNDHTSFEFQTRNYITGFGHICNHAHGRENHTQKYRKWS